MSWKTALAVAVGAVATVTIVTLTSTDAASAQQPDPEADSGWDSGECPLHDETPASHGVIEKWMGPAGHEGMMSSAGHSAQHGQMHSVDATDGWMMGDDDDRGPIVNPGMGRDQMMGPGSMMGSGMGG